VKEKISAGSQRCLPLHITMTTQKQDLDNLQIRFARLAWLSLCLSILTGIAHVRAFPSYNAATALVAIDATFQDNTNADMLLRSHALCGIIGVLTMLADIAFCVIWAGEIAQGYSGLVKLSLVAFISNLLIKGALLYSAMAVCVAASSPNSNEHDGDRGHEERMTPKRRSPLNDSVLRHTPIGSHNALTPGGEIDQQLEGIPGLISPGFDPRNCV
jgi:hypothetical protein